MNSYISVINKIKDFCDNHPMVKRFGADFEEQMGNFATLDNKYPIVYVAPVSKFLGEFTHRFTIDIYSWDLIMEDRSNINTCLSDTDLILTDIWTSFYTGDDYTINVLGFPTITPLNNGLLDYTVGNVMRIDIEVDTYCDSDIPQ